MTRALMNDEGKLRTLRRRLAPGRCRPVWSLLHRSGLAAAIARRYAGIGAIFMFHHVVPEVSAHLNGELYISARVPGTLAGLAAPGRRPRAWH